MARYPLRSRRLFSVLLLVVTIGPARATVASDGIRALQEVYDAARKTVGERSDAIRRELSRIDTQLKDMQLQSGGRLTPEQETESARLAARRSSLQDQLTHLQSMLSSRKLAVESKETAEQLGTQLALFQKRAAARPVYYSPAEVDSFKANVELAHSLIGTIERSAAARRDQLAAVQERIRKHDPGSDAGVLEAQRDALQAQIQASQESLASWHIRLNLLETKLKVASPATAAAITTQPTASGPAIDQKDAENKQRIAEALEREARDQREEARRELQKTAEKMERAFRDGGSLIELEDDREFYEHKLDYETRRGRQAEFEKRIALEKRQIAGIESEIKSVHAAAEQLGKTASRYSLEDRRSSAAEYRAKAEASRQRAAEIAADREKGQPDAAVWDRLIHSIDALEEALRDRVYREGDYAHFSRMRTLLDLERQQVASMQNTSEVVSFAQLRQTTLHNKLADAYIQCADLLDPPQPGFWVRHRTILNAIWIVAIAILGSFALRIMISLAKWSLQIAALRMPGRFSAKRMETLLSFSASIIRVFIVFFAVILVLSEFGFDPAKSTAVFGLISLALTGMFQQIVIDFVKGFDIITGRHYNVGDFVELDGKTGHVIDFSVKHTRIRTASGQEYNLPNSKCIPSRRFPDGYVDNYVDVAVRSSGDVQRARRAIAPICRHLSRRIEQVRDEPVFIDQFPGTRPSSIILRYRVRVLPGSDWVITEQFIPDLKAALGEQGIEMVEEPTFFFINRIQVFRQLFSRRLTEEQIRSATEEPSADEPGEVEQEPVPLQKAG